MRLPQFNTTYSWGVFVWNVEFCQKMFKSNFAKRHLSQTYLKVECQLLRHLFWIWSTSTLTPYDRNQLRAAIIAIIISFAVMMSSVQLVFVKFGILMSLLATRLMLFALHTSIPLNWVLIFYLYKLIILYWGFNVM